MSQSLIRGSPRGCVTTFGFAVFDLRQQISRDLDHVSTNNGVCYGIYERFNNGGCSGWRHQRCQADPRPIPNLEPLQESHWCGRQLVGSRSRWEYLAFGCRPPLAIKTKIKRIPPEISYAFELAIEARTEISGYFKQTVGTKDASTLSHDCFTKK